jgi:2-(1,2-epoxy-1,2-dihydrophenyl)acetyl-CoA isomerase
MAAGADGTIGAATIDEAIHRQRVNQRETAGALFQMPKSTLAALPGPAAGAGLSLALACDLRIMASTAIMTTAFARVGFSGDYGGTYFRTQLVGAAKARGVKLGNPRIEVAHAKTVAKAEAFAASVKPTIAALRAEGLSLRAIADRLNAQGLATSRGAAWTAMQVQRVLRRSAEAIPLAAT